MQCSVDPVSRNNLSPEITGPGVKLLLSVQNDPRWIKIHRYMVQLKMRIIDKALP